VVECPPTHQGAGQMKKNEFMTDLATEYHQGRVLHYMVEEGLPEENAIEKADFDLIEWSKPLPLPDAPANAWWE